MIGLLVVTSDLLCVALRILTTSFRHFPADLLCVALCLRICIIFFLTYIISQQVALKTLIVIHRTLREGDPTFREELLNFQQRGRVLQLANFKDDSSPIGINQHPSLAFSLWHQY